MDLLNILTRASIVQILLEVLSSKFLLRWPIKSYLPHSIAFLVQSPITPTFHQTPARSFLSWQTPSSLVETSVPSTCTIVLKHKGIYKMKHITGLIVLEVHYGRVYIYIWLCAPRYVPRPILLKHFHQLGTKFHLYESVVPVLFQPPHTAFATGLKCSLYVISPDD